MRQHWQYLSCKLFPALQPRRYNLMLEKVYKTKIANVDELYDRIINACEDLDQRVIDAAVRQWRARLRACVSARGGHFEHNL